MFLESTWIVCLFIHVILIPKVFNISQYDFTSLILGKFSIVQTPLIKIVAGIIATAAFFAPLIVTSPRRGVGPVITNFSKLIPPIYLFDVDWTTKIININNSKQNIT